MDAKSTTSIKKHHTNDDITAKTKKLQDFLNKNSVTNAEIESTSVYYCDHSDHFEKNKKISCKISLPATDKEKADKLREQIKADSDLNNIVDIQCSIGVGDKFYPLESVDKIEGQGEGNEDLTISHTPDTVLLVDFWATWCGPCQKPMTHNQEMLQKNEGKWKDKVHIVGASLDNDRQTVVKRVKDQNWNKVEHYILPGAWHHPAPKMYGCEGIPFVVLVDKKGIINYMGHPMRVDLEKLINGLLEASDSTAKVETKEGTENKKSDAEGEGTPLEAYKKIRDSIKEGFLNTLAKLKKNGGQDWVAFFKHSKTLDKDLKIIHTKRSPLVVQGECPSNVYESLKKIIAESPAEHTRFDVEELKSVSLSRGDKCSACSKTLSESDSQYYSLPNKAHFCKECGDKDDKSKTGVDRFVSPNALIYLQKSSDLNGVREDRVADQHQPKTSEDEKKFGSHHSVGCDACSKTLSDVSTRWKCLHCHDCDSCQDCFDKAVKGDQATIKKFEEVGHNASTHVLQRYVFEEDHPHH